MSRAEHRDEFIVHQWTGTEIKALRLAKRLSMKEFGAMLGVSQSMISRWERDGRDAKVGIDSQRIFDTCLAQSTAEERTRLTHWRNRKPSRWPAKPADRDGRQEVDLGGLVRTEPCLPGESRAGIQSPLVKWYERPDMRVALARRDIASVYRFLQQEGVSQRRIANLTHQSQSEISEILAGREVASYDVLARIAEGLGVPRAYMGLGYEAESAVLAVVIPDCEP
jgi:transcriptional regulator with XRE-family HTH domain